MAGSNKTLITLLENNSDPPKNKIYCGKNPLSAKIIKKTRKTTCHKAKAYEHLKGEETTRNVHKQDTASVPTQRGRRSGKSSSRDKRGEGVEKRHRDVRNRNRT